MTDGITHIVKGVNMNDMASATELGSSGTVPERPVPMRWIDTVPVESTDNPCSLAALDLRARVCGLYADVEETFVVGNPNGRDISVDVSIPMPDRAAVRGFALDIDGQMVDGVVVPKERARVAFETEQRIGADPGLVEAVKGNVYRTRVYPVPACGERTVRLRYTAPLLVAGGETAIIDLPMPEGRLGEWRVCVDVELLDCPAPELSGAVDARFEVKGPCWHAESEQHDVETAYGLRLALPKLPGSFSLVERDGEGGVWFVASETAPEPDSEGIPGISSLTVLWDSSGSRAGADHSEELELLRGYCEEGFPGPLRLVEFADRVQPAAEFDNADELVEHLASARYDGGSDFRALSEAASGLGDPGEGGVSVLFTDGLDTLSGETVSFPESFRVVAVVSGAERDAESLRQSCGGRVFDIAAAPRGPRALAQAAFRPGFLSGVTGEGIADVIGVGSGSDGRHTAIGRLTGKTARIRFENSGSEFDLTASAAREGFAVSGAWAARRVAQLSPRAEDNADELLALGRRFGVVSPATSLLVLETLEQWLRYDVEPPATWERMHREWARRRGGLMRTSSESGLAADHLKSLKREWAALMEWWGRDFPKDDGWRVVADKAREGEPGDLAYAAASASMTYGADSIRGMGADELMAAAEARFSEPAMAPTSFDGSEEAAVPADASGTARASAVRVQAWMPDAEYLAALDAAIQGGPDAVREAYFAQRAQHAASPSFFIDCAGWFLANGDRAFGLRVLTNLAELRVEDAALLRVMAWRLREAGELRRALAILRRVLKLRPEDSQSHRDVALVLDELARESFREGDEGSARDFAEEAGAFYRKIALTPWQRRSTAVALFAVEEHNILRAWAEAQAWDEAPQLGPIGEGLEGVPDCDLRITLAWDADETDVDLHVTEPTGEEAYYGNRLTHDGGRVSEDITDGYGPELYEIRHARDGAYDIRAHYYASHQQTVFGPASCTLTVYTDWGRPTQAQQVTSTRLESEHEMVPVGTAAYGAAAERTDEPTEAEGHAPRPAIDKGCAASELVAAYGPPSEGSADRPDGRLAWDLPGGRIRVATVVGGKVERIVERMPWGEEMVVLQ